MYCSRIGACNSSLFDQYNMFTPWYVLDYTSVVQQISAHGVPCHQVDTHTNTAAGTLQK